MQAGVSATPPVLAVAWLAKRAGASEALPGAGGRPDVRYTQPGAWCYHVRTMNLLMLILIFLGIWIAGAILYFAWRLTPTVPKPGETDESGKSPDSSGPPA